jgi:hypothetical protein
MVSDQVYNQEHTGNPIKTPREARSPVPIPDAGSVATPQPRNNNGEPRRATIRVYSIDAFGGELLPALAKIENILQSL